MARGSLNQKEVHIDQLTWREREVLQLLAERLTNQEIGARLHLAESTVKDYVSNILSKLYVKNRRQAVTRAAELGLLGDPTPADQPSQVYLPAEPTPFVGRQKELAEIRNQLSACRLLTLTGPGGIGKSRLALRAARLVAADYPQGVYFVPLAPLSSPDRLVQTISEALRIPLMTQEDPRAQLLRFLQNKHLLLVMDNFEHLLAGVQIVSDILQHAPRVKILATSREKLNLVSESLYIVGGMQFDLPQRPPVKGRNDASAFFIQSAQKVSPAFEPDLDQLAQIETICQMVQGTPLAIELAAAWLQILTLDEIALELKQGFDILSTDARDAPERHRSLRSVFNHSWNLLNRSEQESLMHLSIFRGGFTRLAAQQVAGATLKQLSGLVSKSFLSHDPGTTRLHFHELLRQYAAQKLASRSAARQSILRLHANYFADFMLECWQQLKDERQLGALAEIDADIENVRSAWDYWLDRKDSSQLWKFSKTIWLSHWIRGWHLAGSQLFAQAVRDLAEGNSASDRALRALAMACQGYFMTWLDISEEGYQLTRRGAEILNQYDFPEERIIALLCLAVNAYFMGRIPETIAASEQMLLLARETDDPWLIQFALYPTSLASILQDKYSLAQEQAREQLRISEELGDQVSSTFPLITLGHSHFAVAEFNQAAGYYRRCMQISTRIGFSYALQTSSKYLGKADLRSGDLEEAQQALLECLVMTYNIGFVRDMVNLFYEFARLKYARGHPRQAVELLAFVEQHPYSDNYRMLEGRIRDSAQELLSEIEKELPEAAFQSALTAGRNRELEQIFYSLTN